MPDSPAIDSISAYSSTGHRIDSIGTVSTLPVALRSSVAWALNARGSSGSPIDSSQSERRPCSLARDSGVTLGALFVVSLHLFDQSRQGGERPRGTARLAVGVTSAITHRAFAAATYTTGFARAASVAPSFAREAVGKEHT